MKLPQLLSSSTIEIEARKRALQKREAGQAYRKNAQYQSPKNPLLEALENLLSGKTERDLHTTGQEKRAIDGLFVQDSFSEKEQFENDQNLALKSAVPTSHEVPRVTDVPNVQEEAGQQEESTNNEKLVNFSEAEKVEVPERFIGSFAERNSSQGMSLSGRPIEDRGYQRLFQLASVNYSNHIAMVKNGYRSFDEPIFSKTA